jgi:conjugal transfer pilus assembly protein TraK
LALPFGTTLADGMPDSQPAPHTATHHVEGAQAAASAPAHRAHEYRSTAPRDPLAVDPAVAVKDEPQKAIDLPGVLKLEGADRDLLDPTRVRRISWASPGTQTVYVSSTQPNRIQLPFSNPRAVSTSEIQIDKKATSNNVYVFFGPGVTHPVQLWLEPPGDSSASLGLQLVPKAIPAQAIVVVDDTPAGMLHKKSGTANNSQSEYLSRVQSLLESAALGASPAGYSVVSLDVPPIVVNGLAVQGLRRLSGHADDIYVYTVTNPGQADVHVQEQEFDGEDVQAVSIVPKPLLHPGERTLVAILAKKHTAKEP